MAAAFMARLVNGRTLICELTGERTWGRPFGVCRLDGRDVGAAVVAAGLARDCPRCGKARYPDDTHLMDIERRLRCMRCGHRGDNTVLVEISDQE